MDDRELLELAAKAAGLELNGASMRPMYVGEDGQWVLWNPLTDDGDALRLAVKLGALIGTYANFSTVDLLTPNELIETITVWHHETGGDAYVATRRAIVLAAAEIGKSM